MDIFLAIAMCDHFCLNIFCIATADSLTTVSGLLHFDQFQLTIVKAGMLLLRHAEGILLREFAKTRHKRGWLNVSLLQINNYVCVHKN